MGNLGGICPWFLGAGAVSEFEKMRSEQDSNSLLARCQAFMPIATDQKKYWDLRAKDYDEFYNRILARQQLLAVTHYFLNSLHRRYDTCIDLGCGTGRL